jgi:hypothetical protein
LNSWQSQDQINAALWELTREVRSLVAELKAISAAAQPSVLNRISPSETRVTQPVDENRKLRLAGQGEEA